jgi:hypothetical protein
VVRKKPHQQDGRNQQNLEKKVLNKFLHKKAVDETNRSGEPIRAWREAGPEVDRYPD